MRLGVSLKLQLQLAFQVFFRIVDAGYPFTASIV